VQERARLWHALSTDCDAHFRVAPLGGERARTCQKGADTGDWAVVGEYGVSPTRLLSVRPVCCQLKRLGTLLGHCSATPTGSRHCNAVALVHACLRKAITDKRAAVLVHAGAVALKQIAGHAGSLVVEARPQVCGGCNACPSRPRERAMCRGAGRALSTGGQQRWPLATSAAARRRCESRGGRALSRAAPRG